MSPSISCNIAIYPPAAIRLRAIRFSLKLKAQKGLFVLDDKKFFPHITLYMTEFPKKNLAAVKVAVQDIARSTKPFPLSATEYHQQRGFIDVRFRKTRALADLHARLIQELNPLREGLLRPRDAARFSQFPKWAQRNLRRYGYDYVFDRFPPHLTFSKLGEPQARITVLPSKSDFTFRPSEMALFRSAEHGTCRQMLARFSLKK